MSSRWSASRREGLHQQWLKEESKPIVGFDFTYLQDRMIDEQPSWAYEETVRQLMSQADSVLDLGTGGGEKFLRYRDLFPARTVVTEGYAPNLRLAQERLQPLGVTVIESQDSLDQILPFDTDTFDLVICRHTSFNIQEVTRILKPGGCFYTQQVDGRALDDLADAFDATLNWPFFTLDFVLNKVAQTSLSVLDAQEWTGKTYFTDVGALVYYLRVVPWLVPNFSVEAYLHQLEILQQRLEEEGSLWFTRRLLMVKAQKPTL